MLSHVRDRPSQPYFGDRELGTFLGYFMQTVEGRERKVQHKALGSRKKQRRTLSSVQNLKVMILVGNNKDNMSQMEGGRNKSVSSPPNINT